MSGYTELAAAVAELHYQPGWSFRLVTGNTMGSLDQAKTLQAQVYENLTSGGAMVIPDWTPVTLIIELETADSQSGKPVVITHPFAVPHHSYVGKSWLRWLLDRIIDVHRHEACEHFDIGGFRPFYPAHGPGVDSYAIREQRP